MMSMTKNHSLHFPAATKSYVRLDIASHSRSQKNFSCPMSQFFFKRGYRLIKFIEHISKSGLRRKSTHDTLISRSPLEKFSAQMRNLVFWHRFGKRFRQLLIERLRRIEIVSVRQEKAI